MVCHWIKVLRSAQVTYQWLEPNLTNRVTLFFKDRKHSKHLHQLKNNLLGQTIIFCVRHQVASWLAVTNSIFHCSVQPNLSRVNRTGPDQTIYIIYTDIYTEYIYGYIYGIYNIFEY